MPRSSILALVIALGGMLVASGLVAQERPRAREAGIVIGSLPTGPSNAITDVPGVRVGHTTLHRGRDVHTGVTAIFPHPGNPFGNPPTG